MAGTFNLCTAEGRDSFYQAVLRDKSHFKDTLSTEDYDNVRIVLEIGYDIKGLTKTGRKKANLGHRQFRSLEKFKRFLGLSFFGNGKISGGTGGYVEPIDWSRKGLCKYKKRAHLGIVELRGERIVGDEILKRYKLIS